MDYKNAGVDIEAGYESVELMKKYVKATMRPEVLGGLGGFSGAFSLDTIKNMEEPVLLSGTDGCGTKVKLAFLMDKHDTIGIDAVAMCVNDVACAGGEPLFFLDYIACGKNYPEKIATIVSGVAEGCKQSSCALIGGETAEHPGLMPEDEYDLAGFTVGVVDKKDIITGEDLKAGDVLIGMASSGVHSNGFSLVRKIFKMDKETLNTYVNELGTTLGEALLAPTRIYVGALKSIKNAGVRVKACSHITGGGFYENIPRMLPEGKHAVVEKNSYPIPPIFTLMAKEGNVEEQMMYNTYNMGLGMILAVDPADVDKTDNAVNSQQAEESSVNANMKSQTISEDQADEATDVSASALNLATVNFSEDTLMEWPVNGNVLLDYSMDQTTYFPTLDQYKLSPAIAVGAVEGAPVVAAVNGKVYSIEQNAQTGTTLTMELGNGYQAVYGQLTDLTVSEGDTIKKGTTIGYIAQPTKYYSTEGTNLYFAMKKDGEPIDPIEYLP